MDLTLFEVHLDDASFTARAPFSGSEAPESIEELESASAEGDEAGGRPSLLPFVIGLAFLAGVGYLLRRRRSGNEEPVPAEIETDTPDAEAPTV